LELGPTSANEFGGLWDTTGSSANAKLGGAVSTNFAGLWKAMKNNMNLLFDCF
jgi:hypothetical protein